MHFLYSRVFTAMENACLASTAMCLFAERGFHTCKSLQVPICRICLTDEQKGTRISKVYLLRTRSQYQQI
jgi:hypothetical protein